MAEEKETPIEKPELDEDDIVKRKLPISIGGAFISSIDIIETCKDLLLSEMPELLQVDLSVGNEGQFDELACECIWKLIKKNDMENKIVVYDTFDLMMVDMPNFLLIGLPVVAMQNDETKVSFLERVRETILKLNIRMKHFALFNPEAHLESETEQEPELDMFFVTDIFNYVEERISEDDVDDLDIGYNRGFEAGTNKIYESIQVSLFKLWAKKRLPVENFYEFMDDLNSTIKGFNEADYNRYKKKYDMYLDKYDKENEENGEDEKK